MEEEEDVQSSRSTFVVVASASRFPFTDAHVLPQDALRRYVARSGTIVLTDDHAPVDNMLAPLFTERFVDEVSE